MCTYLVLGHACSKVLPEGAQRGALRAERAVSGAAARSSRLAGPPQRLASRQRRPSVLLPAWRPRQPAHQLYLTTGFC